MITGFCGAVALAARTGGVSIGPPPDWVRPVEWVDANRTSPDSRSEGTRCLLYELQENAKREEVFTRVILRMQNEAGVQDSGSLSFHFDPTYQDLTLHRVQIHRGGQVLDRLDMSKIKVIQREPDLDSHIFRGRRSGVLFVEDLRVGDALEYAYSTRGANPILGGHYSTTVAVQSGTPVDRQRIRILWSSQEPLHLRQHLTDVQPHETVAGGAVERVWDFSDLAAIPLEDFLPAAFEPYPYLELSDFGGWARVVDWALPLYTIETADLPHDLDELMARWREEASTIEEQALLAVQFVQDDLRYTGLELGPDSYRPSHPFETFQRRFGDCKAKALLLCTLLREMNLDAWPVLVSSTFREGVAERLPSPFAFNHVIVKVNLPDSTVWIDATLSHQGGPLGRRHLPPFGKALVIQPGVTNLEDIPPSRAESTRQQVTSTFALEDNGSPVPFTVSTVYRGSGADQMREVLARSDPQELSENYLNFYARYYPGIESLRPLHVTDDRKDNVLTVVEHYQIGELWKFDDSNRKWQAEFYPESLNEMLTDPRTRLRKMPLMIPFPLRHEQEIVVHLPESEWNIPEVETSIDHDAFAFHFQRRFSGRTVRFLYACETKTGEIPAEAVAGYLSKLEEMKKMLGDTLNRGADKPLGVLRSLNWLMVAVALLGMGAVLAGTVWIWRVGRLPSGVPPLEPADPRLRGLRGWLILAGVGLCLGPLLRVAGFAQNWEGFFSLHVWQAVAMPHGEQFHPLFAPLVVFELLGQTVLLGLNLLAIGLFFAKRWFFPKAYIALMVSNAAFLLIDGLAGSLIPFVAAESGASAYRDFSVATLGALVWCSYMLRSKRVKATFTN